MSLCVEHLSFSYDKSPVLLDVSFTARPGELLAVLGPNGAGKSTLFRCILGALRPSGGAITFNEISLNDMPPRRRAQHIAYIPQSHRPTFGYTVLDTALMGTARQLSPFAQPGQAQTAQALAALELVGMAQWKDKNFAHLSGGEQQLVLIARALTQQADILLMDEPTSSLDYGNQLRVLAQVRELSRKGYTVILSTHNPQQALSCCDNLLALEGGAVAAFGPPREVLDAALMQRLYRVNVRFVDTPRGPVIVPETGGEL